MPPHSRVRRSSLFSCHFHAIRARRRAAVASKSANLHIEGSKVTCIGNFLIRIKNDCFHTVCPYEKPNTLIRQYGISTYQRTVVVFVDASPTHRASTMQRSLDDGVVHISVRSRARFRCFQFPNTLCVDEAFTFKASNLSAQSVA